MGDKNPERFGKRVAVDKKTLCYTSKLEGLAVEEARSSQTIRRILGTMDSYVTDHP